MASPQLARLVEARERVARFLWLGLTLPILVYAGIAAAVAPRASAGVDPARATNMVGVLYAVAAAIALAAFAIRRRAHSDERIRAVIQGDPARFAGRRAAMAAGLAHAAGLDTTETRIFLAVEQAHRGVLVSLALHDMMAVIGLVASILSGDRWAALPFAAAAFALNLSLYPRFEDILRRAEAGARS